MITNKLLMDLITQLNLTQSELSDRLGVAQSTLRSWLEAKGHPRISRAQLTVLNSLCVRKLKAPISDLCR
jgi:transcriptional regulator with XRE-family HTH domain